MRKLLLIIAALGLLFSLNVDAARKRKPKTPVVVEDPKFTEMLSYTAKIVIIDSIVIDSLDFLDAIYTNPEEGRLTWYDKFFKDNGDGIVYLNEIGDKCIYPKKNTTTGYNTLYESNLLSDGWTAGKPLEGIDDDGLLYDFNYPYLMPDGVTLYFSARSSEGLGGYDIYRTRFDQDEGHFLRPENIGLPFNSDADDYMYVVDEENRLAYFVSNRRQPTGRTCVYCFIPFETRTIATGNDQAIRSLAKIEHIADTWGNGTERKAALLRKEKALSVAVNQRTTVFPTRLNFVINDKTTYQNISDFKVLANKERMKKVITMQQQVNDLQKALKKNRFYFSIAPNEEQRETLRSEILQSEQQVEQLNDEILKLEKTIRNTENQY
jgi:hypothetical protein